MEGTPVDLHRVLAPVVPDRLPTALRGWRESFSPVCATSRNCGLRRTGIGISGALRFSAVQTRGADNNSFRPSGAREIFRGNVATQIARSVAGRIHGSRSRARAAGETFRTISFSHFIARQR